MYHFPSRQNWTNSGGVTTWSPHFIFLDCPCLPPTLIYSPYVQWMVLVFIIHYFTIRSEILKFAKPGIFRYNIMSQASFM